MPGLGKAVNGNEMRLSIRLQLAPIQPQVHSRLGWTFCGRELVEIRERRNEERECGN
jgi:hypothetical protein